MKFHRWQIFFILLGLAIILFAGVVFVAQNLSVKPPLAAVNFPPASIVPVYVPPQKLANPPAIIKSVYVTGYSAGTKSYLNYLSGLFKNTEINAVVVDIKDYSGFVSYSAGVEDVKKYHLSDNAISDIDSLVRFLHNQNIYVIGRIVVFQDPEYAKARPELAVYDKVKTTDPAMPVLWQDNHGLSWLDPASQEAWRYDVSLAKNVFFHGFDEVNFDYVRFPSDGKTADMGFPFYDGKTSKSEIIKQFFQYVRKNLPDEKISVDLFGLTTVNSDDMGIGQIIENAFENFDYVCPMVYPSHYANGFIGFDNPAEHPYEVIKYSMDHALAKKKDSAVKLRPWIQDFNMGAVYNADMVKQEIQAIQDSLGVNFSGFMMWNPSNIYTQEAILKPN